VCACVCVCERERDRESVRARQCVCVCVCMRIKKKETHLQFYPRSTSRCRILAICAPVLGGCTSRIHCVCVCVNSQITYFHESMFAGKSVDVGTCVYTRQYCHAFARLDLAVVRHTYILCVYLQKDVSL